MNHLLICPALADQHLSLSAQVSQKFAEWKVPFCDRTIISREEKNFHRFRQAAWPMFSRQGLNLDRLYLLIAGFWKANQHKQCVSLRHFLKATQELLNTNIRQSPQLVLCSY